MLAFALVFSSIHHRQLLNIAPPVYPAAPHPHALMAAGAAFAGGARPAAPLAAAAAQLEMSSAECFAYFNPTDRPTVESRTKEWTAMLLQAAKYFLPGGPAPPPRAATAKWAR